MRRHATLLAILIACLALSAPAAARTLMIAGPASYQITSASGYPTVNGSLGWRGPGDLTVVVGYDPARDRLTLRCTGHGVAHLRVLARGRPLARATCTGQDVQARGILHRPPPTLRVVGVILAIPAAVDPPGGRTL